jgi:hypothetical protein
MTSFLAYRRRCNSATNSLFCQQRSSRPIRLLPPVIQCNIPVLSFAKPMIFPLHIPGVCMDVCVMTSVIPMYAPAFHRHSAPSANLPPQPSVPGTCPSWRRRTRVPARCPASPPSSCSSRFRCTGILCRVFPPLTRCAARCLHHAQHPRRVRGLQGLPPVRPHHLHRRRHRRRPSCHHHFLLQRRVLPALSVACGSASSSASSPSTTPLTPTAPCVTLPSATVPNERTARAFKKAAHQGAPLRTSRGYMVEQ